MQILKELSKKFRPPIRSYKELLLKNKIYVKFYFFIFEKNYRLDGPVSYGVQNTLQYQRFETYIVRNGAAQPIKLANQEFNSKSFIFKLFKY